MASRPFCMKLPAAVVEQLRAIGEQEANSAACVARRLVMQGLARLTAEEEEG